MLSRRPYTYKPPFPYVLNAGSAQARGLIGWWPGGSGAGGKMYDLSGYQRHGTLTNFATPFTSTSGWTVGKDGGRGALYYDGNQTFVNLGDNFGGMATMSVACWFMCNNVGSSFNARSMVSKVNNVQFYANHAFSLGIHQPRGMQFVLGGPNQFAQTGVGTVAINVPNHVLGTYDGITIKIYLNGILAGSQAATGTINVLSGVPTYIGGNQEPSQPNWFPGWIEDVRIYNRALSASEAEQLVDPRTRWELRYQPGRKTFFHVNTSSVRTGTDAPTTSESVVSVITAPRTVSDIPTLSEVASIVSSAVHSGTDIPATTEDVTRTLIGLRTVTDSPTVAEDAIVLVVTARITTDDPTLSEDVSRTGTFVRATTDTPTTSETAARTLILSRAVTDAPTLSESVDGSKTFIKSTTDSPTTSETVTALKAFGKATTDSPTLSEVVTLEKINFKSIGQTLTLSQLATVTTPNQSITQSLAITQSVVSDGEFSKSASNSLNPIQSADYFQFKPISVSNSLTITQTVDEVQTTGLGNTLTITQDVAYQYDPHLDQRFGVLVPTQTVAVAAIFNRSITQPVTLVQSVVHLRIVTQSITSTLGIYQTAIAGPLRNGFNTLVLDQSVDNETIRNPALLTQALHVTQSVGLQLILNRSLTSTLLFKNEHSVPNGAGGFVEIPNLIFTRGGSGLVECCPVARATTVFQSSTRAIVLPNPEFNDSEGLVAAVSIKRTITGDTYSYVKKSANRKLKYKFLISQRKAYELRRFLLDFLGDRIVLTNWKGEIWSGYILTDPAEITSNARGGICTGDLYEVDLEYQGVRVN